MYNPVEFFVGIALFLLLLCVYGVRGLEYRMRLAWPARRKSLLAGRDALLDRLAALMARLVARLDALGRAFAGFRRARGVQPGPWAWFQVLPDVVQAILVGLALSVPLAAVALALFRVR